MKSLKYFSQKIAIIAILLISFFGMNLKQSEAQPPCPTGYTSGVFQTFVDGCWYEITLCYKCSAVSHIPSEVMLYSYRPLSVNCIPTKTDAEIMELLRQKGVTFFLSTCVPTPCGETPIFYFVENEYACWKRTGANNEIVEPCTSNAICQTLKSACRNNNDLQTTTYYSDWQNTEPDCGSITNEIPQNGSCVRLKTLCDD